MAKNDSDLQHDVIDELDFEPTVDASRIGVAARDGIVTLTGSVPSFPDKIAAEAAAKRVAGVHGIADELQVDLAGLHQRDDTDIATAAVNALSWDVNVPKDRITVKVSNGYVTLEGEVEWQYQKDRARTLTQNLVGVRGVANNITVKPKFVRTYDVKTKIRQAFERQAEIDANQVDIETEDGKVTLRGTVHSWTEHDAASHAAYSVPGVKTVDNLTRVG
jgi:osmotically-inducible protein OsmY